MKASNETGVPQKIMRSSSRARESNHPVAMARQFSQEGEPYIRLRIPKYNAVVESGRNGTYNTTRERKVFTNDLRINDTPDSSFCCQNENKIKICQNSFSSGPLVEKTYVTCFGKGRGNTPGFESPSSSFTFASGSNLGKGQSVIAAY